MTAVKIAKNQIESYDISKSNETLQLADDLAKFIKENNLFMNIQGKAYVNVEGWQYAGSRLGILPVVEELLNVSDDREIKYQAKVSLYNLKSNQEQDGHPQIVGTGYAICSNKENGKRFYQEFAIASMAQTRAIGKAYRNILAWIIRAAGYEPTPAEEMDYEVNARAGATEKRAVAEETRQPVTAVEKSTEKSVVEVVADESSAKLKPASAKQKADILLLLSHKVITAEEKERMVRNINKIDSVRAQKAIINLKKVIKERASDQTPASDAA
ncbi:hypothetical protein SAMN05421823_102477 [Catalinimonas alkaloidigena]|uniref:Uncharacterized protein n=1 Tax=Catalinimonas alkaloidigena TaxID=1075417 RepID=A0A1G9B1F0_9BACT|nr:hypothetical protein [Catalinimonas alkaloidigena]SDK33362.1 hypothetical protein SAMN05421823_102477 [Catalinimonas alkaloidigena]